jgi:hypothetical protein
MTSSANSPLLNHGRSAGQDHTYKDGVPTSSSIPATQVPVRSVRKPIAYGPAKPPRFAVVMNPNAAAAPRAHFS